MLVFGRFENAASFATALAWFLGRRRLGGGASDLDLGVGAVALALDDDGLGVVQQAVQQGRGEDGVVVEDGRPTA